MSAAILHLVAITLVFVASCKGPDVARTSLRVRSDPAVAMPIAQHCGADEAFVPKSVRIVSSDVAENGVETRQVIAAFCIDRYEVTTEEYEKCERNQSCVAAVEQNVMVGSFWAMQCNSGRQGRAHHPINCVDWYQADAYCKWKEARLPTEWEWEHAARGDTRLFPWGDTPPRGEANLCNAECSAMLRRENLYPSVAASSIDDGWLTTAPVGSFGRDVSPFGLFDTAGNVGEWTSSPDSGEGDEYAVMRGAGWWAQSPDFARVNFSNPQPKRNSSSDRGFRCARDAK